MNGIDRAERHQMHQLTSLQSYFYACGVPSEQIKLSFFFRQKSRRCAPGGGGRAEMDNHRTGAIEMAPVNSLVVKSCHGQAIHIANRARI
jgi:hypothetical protein